MFFASHQLRRKSDKVLCAYTLRVSLCALVLTSTIVISFANKTTEAPSVRKPLPPKARQASASKQDAVKIGEQVPVLSLRNSQGALWNSRDLLGQRAILMLLINKATTNAGSRKQSNSLAEQAAQRSVAAATESLRERGVEAIVVVSDAGQASVRKSLSTASLPPSAKRREIMEREKTLDALAPFGAGANPLLFTRDGAFAALFTARSSPATLIAIDRAGLLRLRETVSDVSAVGARMREIGDPTPPLQEGKAAPDFTLLDMNGKVRRLSDLRGRKNLLLTFFPRCFTGGCQSELSTIQLRWNDFRQSETEVWGVSVDPAEGAKGQRAFAKSLGLEFPLIPDVGRNLCILYGVAQSPNQMAARISVLIDKKGIVRSIDKQVNVKTHGADVLAKMRELEMIAGS